MAFLDKLNDFAKNIGDMTTDAIETGKLNSKINSEKNAAGEELKKIGEHYYNIYVQSGVADAEVIEFCNNAKAHYDAVATAQGEIDKIKAEEEAKAAAQAVAQTPIQNPVGYAATAETICPSCGTANAAGIKFCRECGTKIEVQAVQKRFCGACGMEVPEGNKFCPECGQKME